MREKIQVPCEHYDAEKDYYKDTCPDMIALKAGNMPIDQCDYYHNSLTGEDVENNDMTRPCRVRRTDYADKQTIDMFRG